MRWVRQDSWRIQARELSATLDFPSTETSSSGQGGKYRRYERWSIWITPIKFQSWCNISTMILLKIQSQVMWMALSSLTALESSVHEKIAEQFRWTLGGYHTDITRIYKGYIPTYGTNNHGYTMVPYPFVTSTAPQVRYPVSGIIFQRTTPSAPFRDHASGNRPWLNITWKQNTMDKLGPTLKRPKYFGSINFKVYLYIIYNINGDFP